VLNNPEEVLAQHLKIEARMAEGNPPEVIEKARKTHTTFVNFKRWLAERTAAVEEQTTEVSSCRGRNGSTQFPTFNEWMAERESQPSEAS
jgi:hypothetical protein